MLGDEPPDEDSLHSTFATFDPGCMVSELRSLSILTCVTTKVAFWLPGDEEVVGGAATILASRSASKPAG